MTLSSLSPSVCVTFPDRYASPRRPFGREGGAPHNGGGARDDDSTIASDFASESYGAVIKTDLSSLGDVELWLEPRRAAPTDAAGFLGALVQLLVSVRAGDAGGARDAATSLQFELFGGVAASDPSASEAAEAAQRMLDDFRELIRTARLGDVSGAERVARLLAGDLQSALLAPATPDAAVPSEALSLSAGGAAAYETQMEFDEGASSA